MLESDKKALHSCPFATPANIARISCNGKRQTPNERFVGVGRGGGGNGFIWLRTCYGKPEVQEAWEKSVDCFYEEGSGIQKHQILEDAELYNFGSDQESIVSGLLRRIPSICDTISGSVVEDYSFDRSGWPPEEGEDGTEEALTKASNRVVRMVFVADEASIMGDHFRILWLDTHGRCVWENKMKTEYFSGFVGGALRGYGMEEQTEGREMFDNVPGCF